MSKDESKTHSRERIIEAQLSWAFSMILLAETIYALLKADVLWFSYGLAALILFALPQTRTPHKAIPSELTLILAAPMLLHLLEGSHLLSERISWWTSLDSVFFGFALATIGFLLMIELQIYTDVRMNRPFAVFFVVMFTLGTAGFWQVGVFAGDLVYGTDYQGGNRDAMTVLLWNMIGGIVMGVLYAAYMKAMSERRKRLFGFIDVWEVHIRKTS